MIPNSCAGVSNKVLDRTPFWPLLWAMVVELDSPLLASLVVVVSLDDDCQVVVALALSVRQTEKIV